MTHAHGGGDGGAWAALGLDCAEHPGVAAQVRCARCTRPLCDDCATVLLDDAPACRYCAARAIAPDARPAWVMPAVGAAVALAVVAALLAANVRYQWEQGGVLFCAGLVAVLVVIFASWRRGPARAVPRLRDRARTAAHRPGAAGGPYRAPLGHAVARVAGLPPVSGRVLAVALGASLLVTALGAPLALRLPRWLEAEVVFGLWWLALAGVLAVLLYRGQRVADDRARAGTGASHGDAVDDAPSPARRTSWGGGFSGLDAPGDAEGCLVVLVGIVVAAVAVGAAWLLVELVAPALLFLAYWLVMRAVARVANDRHGCEGSVPRATAWAALWASAYVAPLAAIAALAHAVLRARG